MRPSPSASIFANSWSASSDIAEPIRTLEPIPANYLQRRNYEYEYE